MACYRGTPPPELTALRTITSTVKRSPSNKGLSNLGTDGVYRSFNSQGQVVDYKQLSPEEIEVVLTGMEIAAGDLINGKAMEEARLRFKGVDGRDVAEERLMNPGPEGRVQRS